MDTPPQGHTRPRGPATPLRLPFGAQETGHAPTDFRTQPKTSIGEFWTSWRPDPIQHNRHLRKPWPTPSSSASRTT